MGKNKEKVCLFVKPFKNDDDMRGNRFHDEVITDFFRKGFRIERAMYYRFTPKMLLAHYDELVREGREKIVHRMIGDYVSPKFAEKLLNGGKLTEEELNTPGRPVVVFDFVVPSKFARYTDFRDDVHPNPNRPTEVVEGTIENTRKYLVGPTKLLTFDTAIEKFGLKEGVEAYIAASNAFRAKYQYTGVGANDGFNVMHCSANHTDYLYESNNFFNLWVDQGIKLNADMLNEYYEHRAQTTESPDQFQVLAIARGASSVEPAYFDVDRFAMESISGADM